MKRFTQFFVLGLTSLTFAAGCASPPKETRAPAYAAAPVGESAATFRDARAAAAFLIETDADGSRRVVCRANLNQDRPLTPNFLTPAADASPVTFGLAECTGDQLTRIADVAHLSAQPRLAGVPVALAAVCAVDFALSATLTAASNAWWNRGADRKSRRVRALVIAAQGAGGTAATGVAAGAALLKVPRLGLPGAGLLGLVCTGAGTAVGYWLVPPL